MHCKLTQYGNFDFHYFSQIHYYNLIQTLTILHLPENSIGDEGAQYLGSALQTNTVRILIFSSITDSVVPFHIDAYKAVS